MKVSTHESLLQNIAADQLRELDQLRQLASQYGDRIHLYFDDDGVLHKWNNISVSIPSEYLDMSDEARSAYVKEEVYKRLKAPNYFRNLPVQENMVAFAHILQELGFDVQVLSCSINADTSRQKMDSLGVCMPWLPCDQITLLQDGLGSQKYYYTPDKHEDAIKVLLDDHTPNCRWFETYGGIALKCMNDANGKGGTWKGSCIYADDIQASMQSLATCLQERVQTYGQGMQITERSGDYEYDDFE